MTCPQCGATAPEGARFCAACGRELDLDLTVAASDQSTRIARPAAGGSRPSSGWLTSSDSISHGRFAPGAVLDGRYRIIGLLGRGGMGEVYRADDLRLGQPVALKFLPDDVGKDAARLAQFHNEVRAARQVAHPNICRVYDISETDGHLFLSMELVDGEDLAASLRRIGRFAEDKALEIARQLFDGELCLNVGGAILRLKIPDPEARKVADHEDPWVLVSGEGVPLQVVRRLLIERFRKVCGRDRSRLVLGQKISRPEYVGRPSSSG